MIRALAMRLTARRSGADDVGGVHVFGLAEQADGSGWALVFSAGDSAEAPPLDQHCVSDHRGRTAYGAIVEWSLLANRLRLRVSEGAQDALDLAGELVVDLRLPDSEVQAVRTELTTILD